MTLQAPQALWLLLISPAIAIAYVLLLRRRSKEVARYSNLGLVKKAVGTGKGIRRHVPPALFFFALVLSTISLARPSAMIIFPSGHKTIVLAMDISGSMRAKDIEPSRLAAAQSAAIEFVRDQPDDVKLGVVAFSTSAMTVQQPTQDRDAVITAIQRLRPERSTAIGNGIILALDDLFPGEDIYKFWTEDQWEALSDDLFSAARQHQGVPAGSHTSAAVILMTDGRSTDGIDPVIAAKAAATYGVRVFTVGFGSEKGGFIEADGHKIRTKLDENTLKSVAEVTRAAYYRASNAAELSKIYKSLNSTYVLEAHETELSAVFIGWAALFAFTSAALSLLWTNRIV